MKREITREEIATLANEAGEVMDNRFFVIGETLLDVTSYDKTTVVEEYIATDVYNASHTDELSAAYTKERFTRAVAFDSAADAHDFVLSQVAALLSAYE